MARSKGQTIHQISATRQVKGGDQLLEDEATDDEVVTTTHIRLKDDIKRRYPFEKQPCPEDEPLPPAKDGWEYGNAMHAVRTQCEVLDVGKYSNPSFGPFSQVFGSVPGFFWLPKHLGCGIFELSTISP